MRGHHPVHAVGRALRKKLKAAFPGSEIWVSTHGRSGWNASASPSIRVGWLRDPARSAVSAIVEPYQNNDNYKLTVEHLFRCGKCGREHPTGPDDGPTECPRREVAEDAP